MPVCAQCGTENPDIAKLCLACGSALAAALPAQEFRKLVTIVSDLKDSIHIRISSWLSARTPRSSS
ncbi:MAG: zinc-ribbon domain-containing protein [Actinomycetota bacterium]|nr:zinc-ribbon domain-containing protein [Actinomycetota bacterium]